VVAASTKDEGKPRIGERPRPKFQPLSRTGENPPYGILGETMETSASFEARSAPLPYPTVSRRKSRGSCVAADGDLPLAAAPDDMGPISPAQR